MEPKKDSEQTELRKNENPKETIKLKRLSKKQSSLLKGATAGLGGVALGGVVMALMGMTTKDDNTAPPANTTNRKSEGVDMDIPIYSDAPFSDVVTDDMSFGDAFAAARKDIGPGGFFEWDGETYNTYYKEEWDALSTDDQNEFFASVDENHSSDSITDEQEILDILNDDTNDIEDIEDIVIDDIDDPYPDPDIPKDVVIIEDITDDDIVDDTIDDDIDIDDLG